MVSLTEDNKLSLVESLVIGGDVGLDTGHIDFDGHVEVPGSIHAGYRVTCKSLRVEDIQEAEVTVAGDMVVMGGIYDSVVKCKGRLQASHIRKSTILVGGDITVEKEITESGIESGGRCLIAEGTIIHSEITAMEGIDAGNIGTKGSTPSVLVVGVDRQGDRRVKYAKNKMELLKKDLNRLPGEIEELYARRRKLEADMTVLSKRRSKYEIRIKEKQDRLAQLNVAEQSSESGALHKSIAKMEAEQESVETGLKAVQDQIDRFAETIARKSEDLNAGRQELDRLTEAFETLVAERSVGRQATVQATGVVYAGTTVTGPNASLTTGEDLSRLRIHEVQRMDPDGVAIRVMQVSRLD
jgi:uncharacterized protein (DUF342 family)